MRRGLAAIVAVVMAAGADGRTSQAPGSPSAPRPLPPIDAAALVDAYARGDDAALPAALKRPKALAELRISLRRLRFEPDDRRRREQAAAMTIEATQLAGAEDQTAGIEIIEWGCITLRDDGEPTDAEYAFHWAGIALLQGMAVGHAVEVHAEHALRRFPGDPRFELARAVALELRTFPDPRNGERLGMLFRQDFGLLVGRLSQVAALAEVRGEALTRLGLVYLRDDNPERALLRLDEVPAGTSDPWVLYLAHLFRGRALDRLERHAEAAGAYRAALRAVPGAQSATLALATALVDIGDRREASELGWATTVVATVADPWVGYGQGDLRLWPEILTRLREAVR